MRPRRDPGHFQSSHPITGLNICFHGIQPIAAVKYFFDLRAVFFKRYKLYRDITDIARKNTALKSKKYFTAAVSWIPWKHELGPVIG